MAYAAHCVQLINPEEIGLPPRRAFEFEYPDEDNEESDPESDNESVQDLKEPPPPKPNRRWMLENEAPTMKQKLENWKEYYKDQNYRIKQRNKIKSLEEKRNNDLQGKGKMKDEPRPYDPEAWDLNRVDFILSEYVPNGDLANLIGRAAEAREMIPNRILWQFFLCCMSMHSFRFSSLRFFG